MPRRKLTEAHIQARLKNRAVEELKQDGFHFGWLTPITSATKITEYKQINRGKTYIYYRHPIRNTRVVYIGDIYYYLQGS